MFIMLLMLLAVCFTGCTNATYDIGVNSDGTLNASYTISSITVDDKGKFDPEILDSVKKGFEDAGYDVSVNQENGQENIVISKDYVTINSNEKVNIDGVQINPMHYISNGARLTRGFMKNIVEIDADIDLTSLNSDNTAMLNKYEQQIREKIESIESVNSEDESDETVSEDENKTEEISIEEKIEAEKKRYLDTYLPQLNIKLTLKTKGKILNTNSETVSADGKEATWLLIPGTSSNILFECTTGFDKAFLGTAVILIISLLIALFLVIYLIRFYVKQFKN